MAETLPVKLSTLCGLGPAIFPVCVIGGRPERLARDAHTGRMLLVPVVTRSRHPRRKGCA